MPGYTRCSFFVELNAELTEHLELELMSKRIQRIGRECKPKTHIGSTLTLMPDLFFSRRVSRGHTIFGLTVDNRKSRVNIIISGLWSDYGLCIPRSIWRLSFVRFVWHKQLLLTCFNSYLLIKYLETIQAEDLFIIKKCYFKTSLNLKCDRCCDILPKYV